MRALPTIFFAAVIGTVNAQTVERLDDSASPQQRVVASVAWELPNKVMGLSDEQLNTMLAVIDDFELRLDTSKFEGQQARIFLTLPVSIRGLRRPDGLRMSWKTEGLFENGSVTPGDRALIFDGVVPAALMTDIFDITLTVDTREVIGGLNFDPIYEIEIF